MTTELPSFLRAASVLSCPVPAWDRLAALLLAGMLLALLALVGAPLASGAGEASIAVIYPDIGEPYRRIFEEIIEGIENKAGSPVVRHAVSSGTDRNKLSTSLRQQNSRAIIALGRQGMKTAEELAEVETGMVVGGVLTVPESEVSGQPVISLSPDPALLFARLKSLMPTAKRVFVVYNPEVNSWLIKMANEAAIAQGLELVAFEAQDVRSSVHFYQEFFSIANSRRDALWLPQDPSTVEENSILPLVLEKSWNHNLAVFSSNFSHVRRGVLFSLYPDNVALGRSLANLANNFLDTGNHAQRGILPLRDVRLAVNLRTAKHLGLNASRNQNIDMTFPEH